MNKERIKAIKAMEFIARQVNDESLFFDQWLTLGVPDGEIPYGDLTSDDPDNVLESYYGDDDSFRDLMDEFLTLMSFASKSGGLYCDNVCTTPTR